MNYKSINRFFVFTLALVTALAFFGVRPSQLKHDSTDSSFVASLESSQLESIHDCTALPPVGIESKEEQPSQEDDENLDTNTHSDANEINISVYHFNPLIQTKEVRTTSQSNFHCPLYIRIQSILI